MNPTPYELRPDLPEELADLRLLALDLRWSWSHAADRLWRTIDETLWRHTRNPWLILQTVGLGRLNELAGDATFRQLLQELREEQRTTLSGEAWFGNKYGPREKPLTAYFCMEYGLSEALPLYSGGLGVLAGDHLKTASELGIPLVAIGLLYQQGYFRQTINAQGRQLAFYPFNDPSLMPVSPVRKADGEWLSVELELPGRLLRLRAWQVQVGRVILYLLDSNDPLNSPADRGITSELYGGGSELRLQQELVLGIAGHRLLQALDIVSPVCHLNEGHAAFAVLERARTFMQENDSDFETALTATRVGNLFTTHTPVDAGFDRFDPALVEQYLRPWAERAGLDTADLLHLGRCRLDADREAFNMAWLAIHGSGAVNGVSRLHGKVSRQLFQPLFPRWPVHEVPVGHVTNGVHVSSWDSPESDRLWTEASNKERWREELLDVGNAILQVSDADLWEMRCSNRQRLVDRARRHQSGRQVIDAIVEDQLDPNVLTLGFARRFASYKRPNLLLHDPDRLVRLLTRIDQPVQLVLAGKAHPKDREGQDMIRDWVTFIQGHGLQLRVVFLVDYDLLIAGQLIEGVDVWINTPRRPWEACGTSGMKVLVNGGLNLSELDGWWAEAWRPEVGWALGDGREHDTDPAWDAYEANALYDRLEQEIVPAFYRRNPHGIPEDWVAMMRRSMAELTPTFSTNRMLREYAERFYLPMAEAVDARSMDKGRLAQELCAWRHRLAQHWPAIRFGNVQSRRDERAFYFEVQVYLDDLDPEEVRVELYAEPSPGETIPERHALQRMEQLAGAINGFRYELAIPAQRVLEDYTVRVIPSHPQASVPLECTTILWQH